jgi:hypothetical protein
MAGFNKRSLAAFWSVPTGTANKCVNFYGYATEDANATVLTAGYFNDAREKLKVNDIIICMSVAAGTGVANILKVTAAPSTGNVTVADSFAAPA